MIPEFSERRSHMMDMAFEERKSIPLQEPTIHPEEQTPVYVVGDQWKSSVNLPWRRAGLFAGLVSFMTDEYIDSALRELEQYAADPAKRAWRIIHHPSDYSLTV